MPEAITADTGTDSALSSSTAAPATEASQDQLSESNFQAFKESENQQALDRAAGRTPAKKTTPKAADPAPATEDDAATATEDESKSGDSASPASADTAAASAAAPTQKKGKTREDSDRRFHEITLENRQLRERLDRLERGERPAAAKEPGSQPAAAPPKLVEPTIDDIDEKTGQPKFETLADYLAAVRRYDKEALLSEVDARQLQKQQERARQEQEQAISKGWNDKVVAARKTHADYDQVALGDMPLPAGSVADAYILDSEHGAEILYHLGQHPDILAKWYEPTAHDPKTGVITKYNNLVNPIQQARQLAKIEATFVKPAAASSAPRLTRAPAPPHEVSGQGAVPSDETEQALKDDDFPAYKDAENRKALARAKGQ